MSLMLYCYAGLLLEGHITYYTVRPSRFRCKHIAQLLTPKFAKKCCKFLELAWFNYPHISPFLYLDFNSCPMRLADVHVVIYFVCVYCQCVINNYKNASCIRNYGFRLVPISTTTTFNDPERPQRITFTSLYFSGRHRAHENYTCNIGLLRKQKKILEERRVLHLLCYAMSASKTIIFRCMSYRYKKHMAVLVSGKRFEVVCAMFWQICLPAICMICAQTLDFITSSNSLIVYRHV